MSIDHLLLWLSAKGEGSWAQFRGAVEELHVQQQQSLSDEALAEAATPPSLSSDLPIYQQVRFALERLGHLEFQSGNGGHSWRVVPPSLALLPGIPEQGILCGARPRALLENLRELATVEAEESQTAGMPCRVLLRSPSPPALAESAMTLGIELQRDAPLSILSATPHVRDPATWQLSEMPGSAGWTVHRFSTSGLQWQGSEQSEAKRSSRGLFRYDLRHQRFYYLRWNSESYRVPVQVAKYALLSPRRRVLRYERTNRVLLVPVPCRPPLLVERALILCSGFLPRIEDGGYLTYQEVPPDVARLATQLLGQEM